MIASGLFSGSPYLSTLKTFGAEEKEHVTALHKVAMSLGKPAAKPKGKFPLTSASEAKALAASFAHDEQKRVDALITAINAAGGTPVKKPTFAFPVTDQASFLKLAYAVENLGVGVYNGAGPTAEQGLSRGGWFDRAGGGAPGRGDRSPDQPARDPRTVASTSR